MKRAPAVSTILILVTALAGCGSETGSEGSTPSAASPAQPVMGTFELPDTSFAFRLISCDLTGKAPDGLLMRGSGTMPDGSLLLPDGRRMGVEVERLTPETGGPGWLYERTTVQFGTLMEEDAWEATAMSTDGVQWSTGDRMEKLDGPIIEVSGSTLVVAATYKHESSDEMVQGAVRITCPGLTYPGD